VSDTAGVRGKLVILSAKEAFDLLRDELECYCVATNGAPKLCWSFISDFLLKILHCHVPSQNSNFPSFLNKKRRLSLTDKYTKADCVINFHSKAVISNFGE